MLRKLSAKAQSRKSVFHSEALIAPFSSRYHYKVDGAQRKCGEGLYQTLGRRSLENWKSQSLALPTSWKLESESEGFRWGPIAQFSRRYYDYYSQILDLEAFSTKFCGETHVASPASA